MEKDIISRIEPLADELLERLRAEKKNRGYTMSDIAEGTGISEDNVSRFFNGKQKNPNVYNVMAVCVFLGLSLDELLGNPHAVLADIGPGLQEMEHKLELLTEREAHHMEMVRRLDAALQSRKLLIYSLLALCAVMMTALLFYMGMDVSNLNFGFVQHSGVSPVLILIVLAIAAALAVAIGSAAKSHKKRKQTHDKTDKEKR